MSSNRYANEIKNINQIQDPLTLANYIHGSGLKEETFTFALRKLQELLNKRTYGFLPAPKLAEELRKIKDEGVYKKLKSIVGNHSFLPLIRVGLFLDKLNDAGQRTLINNIREDVKNRYKKEGMLLLKIATTGTIKPIIDYLDKLRDNNYNRSQVIQAFEQLIREWERITIGVKKTDFVKDIKLQCIRMMDTKLDLFFIYSYGYEANNIAFDAIVSLIKDQELRNRNYSESLVKTKRDSDGVERYCWIIERFVSLVKALSNG